MKYHGLFLIVFFLRLSSFSQALFPEQTAEDLWGNKIPLGDQLDTKTVTIVPFSTSNCGYCMIDGFFGEENYIRANERNGGVSYHICLFNPQLDVYAFQKHFDWKSTVLAFPPSLHRFHEDGFPTLLAFKNGNQVLKEFTNYALFDTLKTLLWDQDTRMIPTGNLHLATRFLFENGRDAATLIFPSGKPPDSTLVQSGIKWKAYHSRSMEEVTLADLQGHLFFSGDFGYDELTSFFGGRKLPFGFTDQEILAGDYAFSFDSSGIYACFPSPFNREKYVILDIPRGNRKFAQANHLDYMIYRGDSQESFTRLVYGHFRKSPGQTDWRFDPELAFSDRDIHQYCKTKCPAPAIRKQTRVMDESRSMPVLVEKTPAGKQWTLGYSACRFPVILADSVSGAWVAWEDSGNILLTNLGSKERRLHFIENDSSSSYNPALASAGGKLWVFWLGRRDGYYRVYGRYLSGGLLSEEILISGRDACDAVTLTALSDGRRVTVAWCDWKANFRYLKKRELYDGVLEEISEIKTVPSKYTEKYVNAWYPSLCYGADGKVFGAWNQHYPGMLCVCGGDLENPAPITRQAEKMDDWETGGYPCIDAQRNGRLQVVWESGAWDVFYNGKPQEIRYAAGNEKSDRWSLGETVSGPETMLNQTPVMATDRLDNLFVIWSGRKTTNEDRWRLYFAVKRETGWSVPVAITGSGVDARHPKVSYNGARDELWISWHSGAGDAMKTRVLKCSPGSLLKIAKPRKKL